MSPFILKNIYIILFYLFRTNILENCHEKSQFFQKHYHFHTSGGVFVLFSQPKFKWGIQTFAVGFPVWTKSIMGQNSFMNKISPSCRATEKM